MAKPLAPGFKLSEGSLSDWDELWRVWQVAYQEDGQFKAIGKDCEKEEYYLWAMKYLAHRWRLSDITFSDKVTEESTGRIIGWAGLQFPWADCPLKEEELAIANSNDMPPSIKGMNMEVLSAVIETLSFADQYGYDPQTDYQRKGTVVHPDFQRRGFGTHLIHHCNSIADKTGGKTWVVARPTSVEMFRKCGFKDGGTCNINLVKWGGKPEDETSWLLVRDTLN